MDLVPFNAHAIYGHHDKHHQAPPQSSAHSHHDILSEHEEHGSFDKHAGHHTHDFL
jgi:hypothetical protein